jgi:hypothetical protein
MHQLYHKWDNLYTWQKDEIIFILVQIIIYQTNVLDINVYVDNNNNI